MPDSLKLDMAIKYSADTYHGMLEEVGGCGDSQLQDVYKT